MARQKIMDFRTLRHPRVGGARQTKIYLSFRAFDLLKQASHITGLDMSAIVDTLIIENIAIADDEPAVPATPAPDAETKKRSFGIGQS